MSHSPNSQEILCKLLLKFQVFLEILFHLDIPLFINLHLLVHYATIIATRGENDGLL